MRTFRRIALFALTALAACAPAEDPLDAEGIESVRQELRASGAKRYMVACDSPCDESALRDAVALRGGHHGPMIGDRRAVEAVMDGPAADDLRTAGYRVEEDRLVAVGNGKPTPPPPAEVTPWGVSRLGAPAAWPTTAGSGVKVVVIDTGKPSHSDLAAGGCANFTSERNCDDNNGHSTHVAGTIAALDNTTYVVGMAPQATMAYCKALTRNGTGYYSWIISCIDWARLNGADVINMSLGGATGSTLLEAACDDADAAGVLVFAAAGNEGPGAIGYPAYYASVISIGATDADDAVAYFSDTNDDVEFSAPGVSILSTCKGGGLCTYNGTSMASPHAAGAGALVRSANPSLSNDCVRSLLRDTATDLGPSGRDDSYGHGLIDADAAVAAAATYVCP
jgi:subtilisin